MDKVVFITGASRGIGAATVKKFADNGWKVAGFYQKNKIENSNNQNYYQLDVAEPESIKKAFEQAFADFGRVDCLVNCAGVFGYKSLADYDWELMQKVIGVNEVGMYWCTKEVLKFMQEGAIVNISSTAAQVGSTDPVYAGTKAAVLGFTKAMAKALAPKIRVNCVAPGITETDLIKGMNKERFQELQNAVLLKKVAKPEDVANGIYFLASGDAGHITGACLDINGGYVLR
ncbi:hypothetical protein A2994_01265 [candidate division Kazan bacterium RIFCSPLOWO2_01_FULL_48_13]|uniref:3-oxoacyl-ACP reductase n=1 Tax=candidate division Kazan bacterium RIFCSPLOWO2_01_FULL_48_13 TaxID=1798539 RepID=A0A1F4PMW5_UNCK3|nr:MAG: hypothetical protein A2994_01265 [candidate division Kazan bacterium RIFCSPLOWO2_01_FULL_48_13]